MKRLLRLLALALLFITPFALSEIVEAALKPVTFIGAVRAPTNDDGSSYDDPKGYRFQCGTTQGGPYGIEIDILDGGMTPPLSGAPGQGTTLDNLLGSQSDGDYFCIIRDINQQDKASVSSSESERITKTGTVFLVTRPAPDGPVEVFVE